MHETRLEHELEQKGHAMGNLPVVQDYPLPRDTDLPTNHVSWKIEPDRTALLVHDMQRYFLSILPPRLSENLLHHTERLVTWADREGIPVLYTAQPGGMSPADRGLLHDFWGQGMLLNQTDREIPPEIAPADSSRVLTKWRYSAFFRSDLRERLRVSGRDQLVLCGVYASVGILATAIEAFTYDIQVFMAGDAVGDFSETEHADALSYVARRCGAVLTTTQVTG